MKNIKITISYTTDSDNEFAEYCMRHACSQDSFDISKLFGEFRVSSVSKSYGGSVAFQIELEEMYHL